MFGKLENYILVLPQIVLFWLPINIFERQYLKIVCQTSLTGVLESKNRKPEKKKVTETIYFSFSRQNKEKNSSHKWLPYCNLKHFIETVPNSKKCFKPSTKENRRNCILEAKKTRKNYLNEYLWNGQCGHEIDPETFIKVLFSNLPQIYDKLSSPKNARRRSNKSSPKVDYNIDHIKTIYKWSQNCKYNLKGNTGFHTHLWSDFLQEKEERVHHKRK